MAGASCLSVPTLLAFSVLSLDSHRTVPRRRNLLQRPTMAPSLRRVSLRASQRLIPPRAHGLKAAGAQNSSVGLAQTPSSRLNCHSGAEQKTCFPLQCSPELGCGRVGPAVLRRSRQACIAPGGSLATEDPFLCSITACQSTLRLIGLKQQCAIPSSSVG